MTAPIFSYGTLQKDSIQMELFGRLLHGPRDVLKGYKLSLLEINNERFFIAIPSNDKNDRIEGTVFEISEEELLVADEYETVEYQRIKAELASGKMAFVYVAANV
jgi:gamma-glutamylcyclotransferase (GGCT)/AIG2-like uncharacterized protein YtfP